MWTKKTSASYAALVYVTVGGLLLVWSAIWFWRLNQTEVDANNIKWYFCYGFLLSGLVLLLIGLTVGQIRRAAARRAEPLPPQTFDPAAPAAVSPPPVATPVRQDW
jgi:hypothetical protein